MHDFLALWILPKKIRNIYLEHVHFGEQKNNKNSSSKSASKNEFSSLFTVRGCSILILAFIKNAIKCLPLSAAISVIGNIFLYIWNNGGNFFNIKMMNLFPIRFFSFIWLFVIISRGMVQDNMRERERDIMERIAHDHVQSYATPKSIWNIA